MLLYGLLKRFIRAKCYKKKQSVEKLLTQKDIAEILSNRKNSPVFKYYGIRLLPTEEHSFKEVVGISDIHDLILIKGNEDTGERHIRERHDFWSIKKYLIQNEDGALAFQNQSKFPMDVAPIDYLKIADKVFSNGNLIEDNRHPMSDLFDLYIGEYEFSSQKNERVKLILYKGTKIIHSLFLVSSKYNHKRVSRFPFARGKVLLKKKKNKNVDETFIPYYDVKSKLRYGISIEKYPEHDLEHIYLIVFDTADYSHRNFIKLLEQKLTIFPSTKHEEVTYQNCDLRDVENFIMDIDYGLENNLIKLPRE
ncbi:hypothetical protein [Flavobacterium sp.]|uniref:hypothetical protein n=1 Tax=Flavobacterium sp. TaxID=239 RepID=UPI002ED8451F